jgi:uncharacterized repeat protein (TIGR04138 family)
MASEPNPQELLHNLCHRDTRYPPEAYEFLFATLGFIQQQMKEKGLHSGAGPNHVTGQQFAEGCRDLALHEFGMMARTVFKLWNIHSTADFGEMVYNLIDIQLMSKQETDKKEDFHNVYDFEKAFSEGFKISLES